MIAISSRSLFPLPKSAGFQNNCSIVVEEHDSHHISLPPINPLAIVQAPAEEEDVLTRSLLPLPKSAGFNCSIVIEEPDSHHISLPPINPLAIVQAPAEDEDVIARSLLPLPKSADFRDNCSIVVEEHDSHHISLPPILAIVQAPAEDEDVLTRSKISVLDDNIQASPITAEQLALLSSIGLSGARTRVPWLKVSRRQSRRQTVKDTPTRR